MIYIVFFYIADIDNRQLVFTREILTKNINYHCSQLTQHSCQIDRYHGRVARLPVSLLNKSISI